MKEDGFKFSEDSTGTHLKPRRGRPKKVPPIILIPTKRRKFKHAPIVKAWGLWMVLPLFSRPLRSQSSLIFPLLSNFSAKYLDQFRTTNAQGRVAP
jgi:hypothetical protein